MLQCAPKAQEEARNAADLHGVLVLPGLLAHEELPQDDTKAVYVALFIVALRSTSHGLFGFQCTRSTRCYVQHASKLQEGHEAGQSWHIFVSCTPVQVLPLASIDDTRLLLAADLLVNLHELLRPPKGKARLTWPLSTSGAVHSGVPAWLLADIHVLRRTRDSPKSQTCMRQYL